MSARRKLIAAGLLGLALVLAVGAQDRWVAAHRPLVVLNRTGLAAEVEVGGASHAVGATPLTLPVGEGLHRVRVRLGQSEPRELEVELAGGFLERLLGGRVFLLNLGAAAPILWEETIYGPPSASEAAPPRIALGELLTLERVDVVFGAFPDDAPAGPLVRIDVAPGEPSAILGALPPARRQEPGALSYAEFHLARAPGDATLLALYRGAAGAGAPARGAAALAGRLEVRPIEVEWHKAYQDLSLAAGAGAATREAYARRLEQEPREPAWHVLAARLGEDPDRAVAGYRAALALAPADAAAHYGLAVHAFRRAEFAVARTHVDAACQAAPRDASAANLRYLVRCAQGEWAALAAELEQAARAAPDSLARYERLLEAQLAAGLEDEARATAQAFRQRLLDRPDPHQLGLLATLCDHELHERWDELRKGAVQLRDPELRRRLELRAALGRGEPGAAGEPRSESERLQLALAWSLREPSRSSAELSALCQAWADAPAPWGELGGALAARDAGRLVKLALSPEDKGCALALLARTADEPTAAELRAWVRRYDFARRFPHPLLARAARDP